MRHIFLHITYLIFFSSLCYSQINGEFGKVSINPYHPMYEYQDLYFPHDFFMKNEMLTDPIVLKRQGEKNITIENNYNDGFTGHQVVINLTSNLQISEVTYLEWDDIEDGSEMEYTVDNIILELSNDPFIASLITGYYTLQVSNRYTAGEILSNEGAVDTTYTTIFRGKFKIYSSSERLFGKDFIIDEYEIERGIKDEDNLYEFVDKMPKFNLGTKKLYALLSEITLSRTEVKNPKGQSIMLHCIVDQNGNIDKEIIEFSGSVADKSVYDKIRDGTQQLWVGWTPARYNGKNVKTGIFLPIVFSD